ncbi:MAG: nucleotidyl transferase AbiEii/AbiGii toxin family protein [Erysipelotrichaceae bacterium]|nr:nucleotidyl transferase AbiEii/AbiGii toxin family protein [Erysipelotrichaceae bacterium]
MINNYILESLKISDPKNLNEFENNLREISQKIILYALSQTSLFKNAAFYGGTCLRIFHNLDRFSEDLDFQVIKEDYKLDFDQYMAKCITTLESYGLKASVYSKPEYDVGEIRRRYIKIPFYDIANEYITNVSMNKEKLISIKIEVSTSYVKGAKYEMKLLNSPLFSNIYCFDYGSLFAGKIHALLIRNWRERTKGRDYFDYLFYLSHNIKFNLEYLRNKLSISLSKDMSNIDLEDIKELLKAKFIESDFNAIKNDIIPFINRDFNIASIDKNMFIDSISYLEAE